MGFSEHLAADRRLVILRFLAEQSQYSLNDSVLRSALDCVAHVISHDQIKADLDWLEAKKLVTLEVLTHDIIVATATALGVDVAQGRTRVDGVKRPGPQPVAGDKI